MKLSKTFLLASLLTLLPFLAAQAQQSSLIFGELIKLNEITEKAKAKRTPLMWRDVNTSSETWTVKKKTLKCSGNPIGVMRSENQFENFMLHIEWMHLEAGGNSGLFIWSAAKPDPENRLPDGVEVQMLELDWVNLNKRDGVTPPIAYVHGELFGVGGVKAVPDNPRGERSKSIENLCKGKGEWNTYDVVAIDGVVKLSINGKVVNGISHATQKKGYICFESEGAPIQFRNLTIVELAPGVTSSEQTAPLISNK